MDTWYALLDIGTKAVLTISQRQSAMVFLRECTIDTALSNGVNTPRYTHSWIHKEPFFLARLRPEFYPEWTWDVQSRSFRKTLPELVTPALRARSRLATVKVRTISQMMSQVSMTRQHFQSGVDFQETVYLTKKAQAQQFVQNGYDESDILNIPYVLQYADLKGLSLRQAAEDILFRAKLDDELLARTELLRLTYFEKVKQATNPDDLPRILSAFHTAAFRSRPV